MKVIVSKSELVSLIGKVQNIVPLKPTVPILANILLEAIDDQLVISATDLSVSMRVFMKAHVLEEGAITVPARKFFYLIRELTSPQVEIHVLAETVSINAGTSHFKLHGMHKGEFPSFPDLSESTSFSLANSILHEMFSRSSFAAAKEDSKQVLNGVLLDYNENKATFIGADGKRLAKLQVETHFVAEKPGSYVIPLKAVEEIIKITDVKEEESKVMLMQDKIALESSNAILVAKLLSGEYPDVSRVIPEKTNNPIRLHREELISLLRQVSLFTSERNCSVRFTFSQSELHIAANSGDIGEGKVNMPVNYSGPKQEIAFHPGYFLDILRHCKDEVVNFDFTGPYNPGVISDSTSALFVIMPMRLET